MVKKPRRISETTEPLIDVIVTNNPVNMIETDDIPTSIGDQDTVGCVSKVHHSQIKSREIISHDYSSYAPEAMTEELESVDWPACYGYMVVNEVWSIMKNILLTIFENHVPKICKQQGGRLGLWLNSICKKLMNDRDKGLRKSRKAKTQLDISNSKHKRNEVNIAIRKAKSSYIKNAFEENSANPNQIWRLLSQFIQRRQI